MLYVIFGLIVAFVILCLVILFSEKRVLAYYALGLAAVWSILMYAQLMGTS
jgi:hypothetical protein